jgi:lysophospholipase L1-like esterase
LRKKDKAKNPFWFYLVMITIPILVLVILEVVLSAMNYGDEYAEWIDLNERYEILNPNIANKYFSGINSLPFSTESFLLKEKPDNSFRVVVLGASSGAGYPFQNSGSFSKYIRKGLEAATPNRKIEVSNISMAAINSYTILDLLPSVVERKPDLILVYLGHNEYYGAMGVGSTQSIANSPWLIKLSLYLKEFRLFQLVENTIRYVVSINQKSAKPNDQTLMAQIAGDKLIEFKSDKYEAGIDQFKSNMTDILEICRDSEIPVIVGTLASNIKDLDPFNSVETMGFDSANKIFRNAKSFLDKGYNKKADSLFRLAKDLDGLRFRAPEDFNRVLINLSEKFHCRIANTDSALASNSTDGIIGDDLMVDHLHPNIEGYQIIGKSFLWQILKSGIVGKVYNQLDLRKIDKEIIENYNFTKYDSTIAALKVKKLKNDWPFVQFFNF